MRRIARYSCAVHIVTATTVPCSSSSMDGTCCVPRWAACVAARGLKHRSLSPDDPFGERSAWEDPSDGIFSSWKDVDQEKFAQAAASEEVQKAHFGPTWARVNTVSKLSSQMIHQHGRESGSAVGDSGTKASQTVVRDGRPSLGRNYQTYEEFVEKELLGGEAEDTDEHIGSNTLNKDWLSRENADPLSSLRMTRRGRESNTDDLEDFLAEAAGEDSRDAARSRSSQGNNADSGSTEDDVELPKFFRMSQEVSRRGSTDASQPASSKDQRIQDDNEEDDDDMPEFGGGESQNAYEKFVTTKKTIPKSESVAAASSLLPPRSAVSENARADDNNVRRLMLSWLNPRTHGAEFLSSDDPLSWTTEEIIAWVRHFDSHGAMDESMVEAFRLANVDGDMLLNKVMPSDLFKVMRKWHVKRAAAVKALAAIGAETDSARKLTDEQVAMTQGRIGKTAATYIEVLDSITAQITPNLIQETIILCFPYCH